jgi:hypothetical protein
MGRLVMLGWLMFTVVLGVPGVAMAEDVTPHDHYVYGVSPVEITLCMYRTPPHPQNGKKDISLSFAPLNAPVDNNFLGLDVAWNDWMDLRFSGTAGFHVAVGAEKPTYSTLSKDSFGDDVVLKTNKVTSATAFVVYGQSGLNLKELSDSTVYHLNEMSEGYLYVAGKYFNNEDVNEDGWADSYTQTYGFLFDPANSGCSGTLYRSLIVDAAPKVTGVRFRVNKTKNQRWIPKADGNRYVMKVRVAEVKSWREMGPVGTPNVDAEAIPGLEGNKRVSPVDKAPKKGSSKPLIPFDANH